MEPPGQPCAGGPGVGLGGIGVGTEGVGVPVHMHGQCVTTPIPFCADVDMGADAIHGLGSTLVATTRISMESCAH